MSCVFVFSIFLFCSKNNTAKILVTTFLKNADLGNTFLISRKQVNKFDTFSGGI